MSDFLRASVLLGALFMGAGCAEPGNSVPSWPWTDPTGPEPVEYADPNKDIVEAGWTNIMDSLGTLPDDICVYRSPETVNGKKVNAYVAVSTGKFDVWSIRDPRLSGSTDDLQTPGEIFEQCKAPIVINGGYFYREGGTNYSASLAVSGGVLLSPNINYASKDWVKVYYPTRAAFMRHADGSTEAAWTYWAGSDSQHYVYSKPAPNSWSSAPKQVPSATWPAQADAFEAEAAIGGGPVLIRNGEICYTGSEELFDKESDVSYGVSNPRTAIGITADGRTVLFVCEGREMTEGVAGLTTDQVAKIMKELGCVHAINLDGGGSTCMLVNGKQTISPSDGKQRSVGSCVVLGAKAPNQGVQPDQEPEGAKPRYVWVDASANFQYFADDAERIGSDLKKIKDAGFTDVIVDVRPTEGVVLFKSAKAPAAKKLAAWVNGRYKFVERTADFDYLQEFITRGHELGLRVNAAINTFVGGYGNYSLEDTGPIFDGSIPQSWSSVNNTADGLKTNLEINDGSTVFLNPNDPDVQNYMLDLLAEIAAYDVDGIILDRCRYDDNGLQSDFSDISRTQFEEFYGQKVKNWPGDIFAPGTTDMPSRPSDIQKRWFAFRAKTIHDFIEKAADKVHSVNSKVRFGVYVGAWYSDYCPSGVNWASPKYDTSKKYKWADKDYKDYGYADHCDFMMLGCYASASSVYGNTEWTMEGFCKLGRDLLKGDTEFAGGPDIGNPSGFENGGRSDVVEKTVDACINAADGYFCFDLCHIRMYDYWTAFRRGFDKYLNSLK